MREKGGVNVDAVKISEALIDVAAPVLAAAVAAMLASEYYFRQERCRLLVKAYSDFFTAFSAWVADEDESTYRELFAAIQTARMLCTESTDQLFAEITEAILDDNREGRSALLAALRKECRDDVDEITHIRSRKRRRKGNQP